MTMHSASTADSTAGLCMSACRLGAVSTVYARENGMGVLLDVEKMSPAQPVAAKPPQPRPKAKPPTLKVVK